MTDNFDTNVSKRKPRTRPVHPWDVQLDTTNGSGTDDNRGGKQPGDAGADAAAGSSPAPAVDHTHVKRQPEPSAPGNGLSSGDGSSRGRARGSSGSRTRKKDTGRAKATITPPSAKASSLSDAINIHSNFCKLDNDVSDHLLCKLSPSAQSVYMRLYRQSFGWNRNWAAESLPKLTKACNVSLQTVRKAIKELEGMNCIRKEFSDYHKATVYRVFLPSEIGLGKSAGATSVSASSAGAISDTQNGEGSGRPSPDAHDKSAGGQSADRVGFHHPDRQNLEGVHADSAGQVSDIHSVFVSGTDIYSLMEEDGPLPKNTSKYMTYRHLANARDIIDEFYDSIGFSVVSRSLYRKSVLDYFELMKSGFSHEDVMYAVRWTFKNSRSRPESFSLVKHTIHDAMLDYIDELKKLSGEKEYIEEKQEVIRKSREQRSAEPSTPVSTAEMKLWLSVVEELREDMNEHSFNAFIEPLKLLKVQKDVVVLGAPPDSVSWINDHYVDRIEQLYREKKKKPVTVTVE